MKTYLIILVTCFAFFNRAYGQSPQTTLDSLVKFKVITQQDRPLIEKIVKERSIVSYQTAILRGVEDIMLQKRFHINFQKLGFHSFEYKLTDSTKRDSVSAALRPELEKINKTGLLTRRVYKKAVFALDSSSYFDEIQMFDDLFKMSLNYELLSSDKLLPIAEQLHAIDIISDSSYVRLKNDITNDKIESSFQLNDYFKLDHKFDVTKYPSDTGLWLKQIHTEIASMLPGLNFTDFNYTVEPDYELAIDNKPGTKFRIRLTCNGRKYENFTSAFGLGNRKGKFFINTVTEGFYRVFNKVLADQHSPYRLHLIQFTQAMSENTLTHFALIALRDTQYTAFMKPPSFSFMLLSMENYDSNLTSASIDTTIEAWKKMGLFTHLSEAQINKGVDDAKADNWFTIDKLLEDFPHVVSTVFPKLVMPQHPCADLLKQLAVITHGVFEPVNISEKKIKDGVLLRYSSNGMFHSQKFSSELLWLDEKFPEFLKQLGRENNLPGDFYSLPYAQDIIFLTKQQYAYAVKYKLLNFDLDQRKN